MKNKILKCLAALLIFAAPVTAFSDGWYICMGSFKNEDNAKQRAIALTKYSIPSFISEYKKSDSETYYRVLYGQNFDSWVAASTKQKELESNQELKKLGIKDFWCANLSEVEKTSEKPQPTSTNDSGAIIIRETIKEVPVEKRVEIIKEVPVEKTVEVIKEVPVEKRVEIIKEVPVEKTVEVIKEVPVEKIIEVVKEVPVEKTVEVIKEVPVEKIIEVVKEVPVEKTVEVIKEVPVEKTVEIIKEVPVEKIIEVVREVPVEVVKEVPVERIIEVIKEVPVEKTVEVIKEVPVYINQPSTATSDAEQIPTPPATDTSSVTEK